MHFWNKKALPPSAITVGTNISLAVTSQSFLFKDLCGHDHQPYGGYPTPRARLGAIRIPRRTENLPHCAVLRLGLPWRHELPYRGPAGPQLLQPCGGPELREGPSCRPKSGQTICPGEDSGCNEPFDCTRSGRILCELCQVHVSIWAWCHLLQTQFLECVVLCSGVCSVHIPSIQRNTRRGYSVISIHRPWESGKLQIWTQNIISV